MARSVPRPARCGWLVAVLPSLLLAGCGNPDDGIKTYKVAVPEQKGKPGGQGDPIPDGPPKVRLLGAIIPLPNGDSYFVKLVGPIEKIDANEKHFDAFLNSIKVPGEGGKPISWTAPAGLPEGPPNQMRVASFVVVPASAPREKSIDLYLSQPFGGDLLQNVNRWRADDVGLPKVTSAELPTVTKEIMLGSTKAYRVDFRGPGGKGMGKGPFMGG